MLDFIPQPKKVTQAGGTYAVLRKMTVGVCGWRLRPAAEELLALVKMAGP